MLLMRRGECNVILFVIVAPELDRLSDASEYMNIAKDMFLPSLR